MSLWITSAPGLVGLVRWMGVLGIQVVVVVFLCVSARRVTLKPQAQQAAI